jgi:hypothetical protein
MDVDAVDMHLTEDDIRRGLTLGELNSTDLIRIGGLWVSLSEFEPVAAEALEAAAREHQRRMLKYVGYLLLFLLGFALKFWLYQW